MPLTNQQIRTANPRLRQYKLSDGRGLVLLVTPKGYKWWRVRYFIDGKERMLSIGTYPEISLRAARDERDKIRQKLAQGIDPGAERKKERAAQSSRVPQTLEDLATAWYEQRHRREVVVAHAQRNWRRLERHVFPILGDRAAGDVDAPSILQVLQRIVDQGHVETAHRVKSLLGQVLRYGVVLRLVDRDPTADIRDALPATKTKHHAAIVDPDEIGPLLRCIEHYAGDPSTRAALRLAPMLLVRPGELRQAKWSEINVDRAEWHVTAKGGVDHLVPLADQAVSVFEEMRRLNGRHEYVFNSPRTRQRPMSNNTVNAALHRLGYKDTMTGHGFRAMARTVLVERLNFPVEIVEMQLAHRVRDVHGRAYNRAQWFDQRRAMMQTWADYLNALKSESPARDQE